ncbi:hypothetical protein [Deinococcus aestuarii]|uniref:hypothetical protein n=1 Tax=Deinococcus aestuarii TaxID=2774531 RepID=UPI001C0C5014|nr:hypothetical protein [Deinococcus aestuarii]
MTLILERAYVLDSTNLDAVARSLGEAGWHDLVQGVELEATGTGGGLAMMVGVFPRVQYSLSVTDGEAGLPEDSRNFDVGIAGEPGESELYSVSVHDGSVIRRGGVMVQEGQVPIMSPNPFP